MATSDTYTLIVSTGGTATPTDGSVTTAKIVDANVTLAKIQNISTDVLLGRASAGSGVTEQIACTSFGRSLIDDSNASVARTTLGLGSIATQDASNVTITGGTVSGITLSLSAITGTFITAVANGGTGLSSFATGDIIYASGASTLSKLNIGAANRVLLSGTGVTPSWGQVNLTTHVTNTLPVANGGTGYTQHQYGCLAGTNPAGSSVTYNDAAYTVMDDITTTLQAGANFTGSLTGTLTYTGSSTRPFLISADVGLIASTSADEFTFAIIVDGVDIVGSEATALVSSTGSTTVHLQCIATLSTVVTTIEVGIKSVSATKAATSTLLRISAIPV